MREEDGCDDVTVLNVMDMGHTAPSVSLGYLPIFIRSACRHAVCGQDHVWLSVHHTRISMEGQPIELRVGTGKPRQAPRLAGRIGGRLLFLDKHGDFPLFREQMRFEIAGSAAARFSHRRVPLSARVPYCYLLLRHSSATGGWVGVTFHARTIDQFLGSRPADGRS
jgi:hypothetical protein